MQLHSIFLKFISYSFTVADPGFPLGGGTSPRGGGAQHTILPNFPKNCMKLKEFGPCGEGGERRPQFYYVDPPLIYASKQK